MSIKILHQILFLNNKKDIPSLIIVTFDKTINTDRNLEIIKNSISTEKIMMIHIIIIF